jgi:hypothetical protein
MFSSTKVETHSWQGPQPRKLSYWSQLVAMLYAQLSGKKSLRDLVFSLGRHLPKLYHLGLNPVKRSTLADANEQRPARVFSETYFKLLHRLEAELGQQSGPQRVKFMDVTYVPVCDSLFPWADFMPGKSAVKLHFLRAAESGTPQEMQVTSGRVHELEVARKLSFAPGDLLLLDRATWTLPGSTPCTDKAWASSPGCRDTSAIGWCRKIPHLRTPQCWPISSSGSEPPIAATAAPSPYACYITWPWTARNMFF